MLVLSNLSYALPNGDALFSNLSFSCSPSDHVTALIGRNGIGKSTLLRCIAEQVSGVSVSGTLLTYEQASAEHVSALRVIDALGQGLYFDALLRVEQGVPEEADIDLLEQHWQVRELATAWLDDAHLSLDLQQPLHTLSGGQRTKVRLIGLFQQQPDVLLLDEPSNHLDKASTQWLIKQLQHTNSTVLLVSHDATLLNSVKHFLVLDEQGVTPHQMDFGSLRALLEKQRQDTQKAISHAKAQLKKEQREQQARELKAEQRQRQGEAERQSGSQSKLLLDRKKNKAQAQTGAQKRVAEQRSQALQVHLRQQQSQQTQVSKLQLSLAGQTKGQRRVLDIFQGVLPYGDATPITISLERGERLRLEGANGSGKSTLIQCILGQQPLLAGELKQHTEALYLDQHLSLLDQYTSPLALLQEQLPRFDLSTLRTLLGSIGLRADRVFLPCSHLSGGERMKVALLLISQLPSEGLLILDETDNHLDLDSQAQLAAALEHYQGALIFVTHQDHWLRADLVLTLAG
ncbi:putative ABC transporter ATP-binding protein YheS [Marinomonas aquimarina]|uniref:Putative ABC transporter ATP-binding protein YheS n=1 Tax=Marinomonas aquimarina TaxID=295068 RepID=A0A1A8TEV6_9GAMM|nr:ATP-binding cassette domain-containing protein [Marinomonas aquimarina]SBS30640.1 putative ABC transporter ATP-binding protein YheS [Marinomonas aquimarina]